MKTLICLGAAVALTAGALYGQPASGGSAPDRVNEMKVFHGVTAGDVHAWTAELVKPEYRGRRTGDAGFDKAAAWAADRLKEWGLKPFGGNGSYFQYFPQPYNDVLAESSLKGYFRLGQDTLVKEYVSRRDFFTTAQSGDGKVTAPVVYVGYGIHAPELGWDDYRGADVKGRVVLCELGIPYGGKNNDSLVMWGRYMGHDTKVKMAAEAGAAGVLYIYPVSSPAPCADEKVVVAFVDETVARDLLKGTGRSLEELRRLSREGKGRAVNTGKEVCLESHTQYYPDRRGCNVIGLIEGSDPVLKNEYIMVGAHLDHLGMMPVLYPGALDNASGSAVALGVAKALGISGLPLKRSVVIALFGAEELGLVGSQYLADHLPFDAGKLVCLVNVDMLGKGTGFAVSTRDRWEDLVPAFAEGVEEWTRRPFTARITPWAFNPRPRTDGAAYVNRNLPAVEFRATGGKEKILYHHPDDGLAQLDPVMMQDAARAVAIAVVRLANR